MKKPTQAEVTMTEISESPHTAEEISLWAKARAARLYERARFARERHNEKAAIVLIAKAGTYQFIAERVLDEKPLKP